MAKILISDKKIPGVFNSLEDVRYHSQYGSLFRNKHGKLYMSIYVFSDVRSDDHDDGTFLVDLSNGEVDNDNSIFPLFRIEKGEQIVLEQE